MTDLTKASFCIKNARYRLGLNQKEFANLININKSRISAYETGCRHPSFKTIRLIVDALKNHNINLEYSDFKEILKS
jgi:transcriptional regulator with XRE-family HTH domain